MLTPLGLGLLLAATSGASSGPDLEERAAAIDLPIDRVMVFSDRARVTRAGKVKVPAGISVVRLPDLPGAVMLDTVRVSAEGAKVVRVETQPVQRERWSIDQVDEWLAELERLSDKIALVQGKRANIANELSLLGSLAAAPPVPEKDRAGKPAPPLAPNEWKALQDRLSQRRAKARANERVLDKELRDLMGQFSRAQREVQKRDLGGYTDQKIEVLAIVDAARADPSLSVEYAVPGAFWKPAYDLAFDPDAQKVELKASGLVTQATGEDWPHAKLALSTAIPGSGIGMPELKTWTLGDDREYAPYATPRAPPRAQQRFQPPRAKPRIAELEKDADRALLVTRSQQLLAMATQPLAPATTTPASGLVNYKRKTVINFEDDSIEGDLSVPDGSYLQGGEGGGQGAGMGRSRIEFDDRLVAPKPASAPPPPPPAPMSVADEEYAGMSEQYDAPSESVVTRGIGSISSAISGKKSNAPGGAWKSLPMYSGIAWRLPVFNDPTLPAVTAGGFDYVYEAPVAADVPSQAQQLRVPLATKTYAVTTFYEATPSLAKTAYLKATVKNGSALPILQGPANVFVKGTFSGDALLATTGPGGSLELPLGADENIRLTRTVIPATRTEGLIMKDDITDYAVKVEIGNYKKRAVTVRVIDQVPKTNEEKVEIALVSSSPKAEEKPDGDGLLYWHVDVPAGGTKTVTFTYRITRPKGWRLSQ